MRSVQTVASTHDQSRPWPSTPCLALTDTSGVGACFNPPFPLPPSCLPSLGTVLLPALSVRLATSSVPLPVGTMQALTPATVAAAAGLSAYPAQPSRHSASNHVSSPDIALTARSACPVSFRLRHERAGSPPLPAESSSSSCGLPVRLRLLPTPPRGDAVTFGYKGLASLGANFHRADCASSRTHSFPRKREPMLS
jgi:hypothetical protein